VGAAGRVVGWARVGVGPGEHAALAAAMMRDGVLYTVVAIVIGALLAVWMARALTARLQQIRAAADAVRAGQHALRVPDAGRKDEVGAVARGFNAMLDTLAHERQLLRTVVETLPDMVWMKDTAGRYLLCNPPLERVFGRREADILGRTDHELLPADFADHLRLHDQRAIDAGKPVCNEEWVTMADDGRRVFVETVKAPMYDADGRLLGVVGIARDYTERLRADEQLRLAASVFAVCLEGIVITDADNRIIDANPAFTRITGFERDEVIGRTSAFLSSVRHGPDFHAAVWKTLRAEGLWRGEMWTRGKFGEEFAQQVSIAALRDGAGQITHYIELFTDISDLKAHEAELEELAHHDPLTGLPNRRLLRDRIGQAHAQAARGRHGLGVALVDLDGFKPINDRLGHEAGDRVLRAIAERLGHCLRGGDTVARLGGDEFVLLLVNLADAEEAGQVLDRVLHAVAQPITLGGHEARVTASIGLTVFPDDDADPDTLLSHADAAMYRAKAAGRNNWQSYRAE
jgi:diguanylate cyclase (GGDEF)-like protein/PAS domain S-box-containing protein